MLDFIRSLLTLPSFADDDRARVASLLNYILAVLVVGSFTYIIITFFAIPDRVHRLPFVLLIGLLAMALRILLHRGYVRLVSRLLVIGLMLILTAAMFTSAGLHSPAYNAYIVVTLVTALLLGGRAALAISVVSLLIGLIALYGDQSGLISFRESQLPLFALWLINSAFFVVVAALLYLASHQINQALQSANRSNRALAERERQYRTLMEQAGDGIFIADRDGDLLDVNTKAHEMLGYSRQELLKLSLFDIITAESLAAVPIRFDELRSEQSLVTERDLRRKDGTALPVEISSKMLEDGRLLGIVRDISQRKQAEETLRQERDFSNAVIDSLPGVFYLFDEQGNMLRWNQRVEQVAGYSADEIETMHPLEFVHENERERVAEKIIEAFHTGEATTEAHFLTKDGTSHPYYFTGNRIQLGDQSCIAGVGIDITDRQQAEAALAEQAEILQTIFDHIPVMIAFFDQQGRVKLVNQEWQRVLGWSLEEVQGRNDMMVEFYPDPEYRQTVIRMMQALEPGWHDFETTVRDGRVIDTTWANIRLSDGTLIGIGRDITARKQAERAMEESEARYRALAESSSVGIWHIDTDGNTVYANPAMCAMVEVSDLDELQQYSYQEFFTADSLEVMRREHARRGTGIASNYEVEAVGKRGGRRHILVSGAPIMSADGELEGLIGTFVDITDRKQAEAQRLKAERLQVELESERKINELKNRFMSIVSHEFRTPLSVINLKSDLLGQYWDRLAESKRKSHMYSIKVQIRHLERLLEDFSLVVRAQAGHLDYVPHAISLDALCRSIVTDMQPDIERDLSLTFENHTATGKVVGDERLLDYIIRNLLSNAIKYSPHGGNVICRLLENDGGTMIIISDEGIGIPPSEQERLFEAYYRATNVGQIHGTGLGLKIVKDCVDVHGGRITVESEPGKGSVFSVWLPGASNL